MMYYPEMRSNFFFSFCGGDGSSLLLLRAGKNLNEKKSTKITVECASFLVLVQKSKIKSSAKPME